MAEQSQRTDADGPKCQTCFFSTGERRWWPCSKCKHSPRQPVPSLNTDHWKPADSKEE